MKLMILDGNSVVNRAYYGLAPLTTPDGLYTHAIYGFLNILQHMENEERPEALCVAFDLHGPTFRHQRYEGYKATRHGMPEELAMQMPWLKDVLRAMRIPIFEAQGWEADDVIGTVAKECSAQSWDCVVVTGDRDQLQLVDERVTVKFVSSKRGQTQSVNYTPQVFRAEYGFDPPRLVDLKALMGDSSDNIPGVSGVGPKTATDLLLKYGDLQGVYDHLDDGAVKGKLLEKLKNGKESAFLSYELATIICKAPIDFAPENCLRREPDGEALYALFQSLHFEKLMDRYRLRQYGVPQAAPKPARKLVTALPKDAPAAIVVDEAWQQAAVAGSEGVLLLQLPQQRAELEELLQDGGQRCCADAKTLCRRLLEHGMQPVDFQFDVVLAAYLLEPSASSYELSRLSSAYLEREASEDLAAQAAVVFDLWQVLAQRLEDEGMTNLLTTIELPLCRVLAQMEHEGVAVDRQALEDFGQMLSQRIAALEQAIYADAGEEFNINSTKKLGEILFEKLNLPPVKKTRTGYSTNVEVLEKLRGKHPIVARIMDYRTLTKLKSTYADGLLKVIGPDGRIHTTFQNTVTATGRLSSTDPNLQNIPVRTELGAEMRKMLVARPGWVLVDADYSQIELRVLAHIAGDKNMQEAFCSGADFHAATAAQVFGLPLSEVTPALRRSAKAVNFGIVYGISKWSLAEDLGVRPQEAESYINSYLEKFSGVRAYMHDIVDSARQTGFVQTLYGRRRRIPELKSSNFNIRSGAERIALNTPIQGSAADIIKLAMLRVSQALEQRGLQARLLLQVHDELIVECPEAESETVKALVTQQMEQVCQLAVPLIAEAKAGRSWYDAK